MSYIKNKGVECKTTVDNEGPSFGLKDSFYIVRIVTPVIIRSFG